MLPAGMVNGAKGPELGFFPRGDCAQAGQGSLLSGPGLTPFAAGVKVLGGCLLVLGSMRGPSDRLSVCASARGKVLLSPSRAMTCIF